MSTTQQRKVRIYNHSQFPIRCLTLRHYQKDQENDQIINMVSKIAKTAKDIDYQFFDEESFSNGYYVDLTVDSNEDESYWNLAWQNVGDPGLWYCVSEKSWLQKLEEKIAKKIGKSLVDMIDFEDPFAGKAFQTGAKIMINNMRDNDEGKAKIKAHFHDAEEGDRMDIHLGVVDKDIPNSIDRTTVLFNCAGNKTDCSLSTFLYTGKLD